MAVFRVEKTGDYTVMSNYHLRDKNLSCKACGLLSKMLSLPDTWDYTVAGLASICKEGKDSIASALHELEDNGYLIRQRTRDSKGRMADCEYYVYERPHRSEEKAEPDTNNPFSAFPEQYSPQPEKTDADNSCSENTAQLNTYKSNTDEVSIDKSSTEELNTKLTSKSVSCNNSFIRSFTRASERTTDGERERIRQQIEYDYLITQFERSRIDELFEIMLEVSLNRGETIRIGRDAEYPTDYVQERFEKITSEHIAKVIEGINENKTRVINTRAYLMAALFNSVSTLDSHYAMLVNHDFDFYGG